VRLLLEFVPHSGQSQLHALVRPLGLGIGILPEVAILASHRVFKREGGVSAGDQRGGIADDANPASRHLVELLVEFCSSMGSELK
jgi:hypothetical protein